MNDSQPLESIIAVDIGSTITHVCLIDSVEGTHRLVACAESPTTSTPADGDITGGMSRAIRRIEQIVQRRLLDRDGEPIMPERASGEGCDAFVVTCNAADPVRCAVIGLTDDLSLDSARHACASSHATITQTITLGARDRGWDSAALAKLRQTPPEVIVLTGGIDRGPTEALETSAHVLMTTYGDMERSRRPILIYAGNQEARRPVANLIGDAFDLRVIDNVRPSVYVESISELQRELAQIYSQVKLVGLPGYDRLQGWCSTPLMATDQAFGSALRFIARRNGLSRGVLGVDIGGSTTFVGAASEDNYQWTTAAQIGTSYGVRRLVELAQVENIRRWVPMGIAPNEILRRLENAWLRPLGVPQTSDDLMLTHALAREALLETLRRANLHMACSSQQADAGPVPAYDLIALRGGTIAHTPQDGLIALTALDALQPVGLTRLVVDWASMWPQIGALAKLSPLAASQVLERDGFRELGTMFAPRGEARDSEVALELDMTLESGTTQHEKMRAGTIRRYPLPLHEQATLEVRPSRSFDIGLGRKGSGGKATVRGGTLGIVVDTRGRPLALPQDEALRGDRLQLWLGNLINDIDRDA